VYFRILGRNSYAAILLCDAAVRRKQYYDIMVMMTLNTLKHNAIIIKHYDDGRFVPSVEGDRKRFPDGGREVKMCWNTEEGSRNAHQSNPYHYRKSEGKKMRAKTTNYFK